MSHHLLVIIPGQELCICDFIPQGNLVEGCGNEASVAIRNLHKIIQIENIRIERSTQVSLSPSPMYFFSLNQAASMKIWCVTPMKMFLHLKAKMT